MKIGLFSFVALVAGGSNGVVSLLSFEPNIRIGDALRAEEGSRAALIEPLSTFLLARCATGGPSKEKEVSGPLCVSALDDVDLFRSLSKAS